MGAGQRSYTGGNETYRHESQAGRRIMEPQQILLTFCLLLAWLVTLLPVPGAAAHAFAHDQQDADEIG